MDPDPQIHRQRMQQWRKDPAVVRIERPTKIERARSLGYKAKQGIIVTRAKVRKGARRKARPARGRRPKRMGLLKITAKKNLQVIAEERTSRRFPNLEVLSSYHVGSDGTREYFEVILLDPHHPSIKSDPQLAWVLERHQRGRVYRGLTRAGRKARGLTRKGKGAERLRPGVRARGRAK